MYDYDGATGPTQVYLLATAHTCIPGKRNRAHIGSADRQSAAITRNAAPPIRASSTPDTSVSKAVASPMHSAVNGLCGCSQTEWHHTYDHLHRCQVQQCECEPMQRLNERQNDWRGRERRNSPTDNPRHRRQGDCATWSEQAN